MICYFSSIPNYVLSRIGVLAVHTNLHCLPLAKCNHLDDRLVLKAPGFAGQQGPTPTAQRLGILDSWSCSVTCLPEAGQMLTEHRNNALSSPEGNTFENWHPRGDLKHMSCFLGILSRIGSHREPRGPGSPRSLHSLGLAFPVPSGHWNVGEVLAAQARGPELDL